MKKVLNGCFLAMLVSVAAYGQTETERKTPSEQQWSAQGRVVVLNDGTVIAYQGESDEAQTITLSADNRQDFALVTGRDGISSLQVSPGGRVERFVATDAPMLVQEFGGELTLVFIGGEAPTFSVKVVGKSGSFSQTFQLEDNVSPLDPRYEEYEEVARQSNGGSSSCSVTCGVRSASITCGAEGCHAYCDGSRPQVGCGPRPRTYILQ